MKKVVLIIVGLLFLIIGTGIVLYNVYTSPVSKSDDSVINFQIESNDTFYNIGSSLEEMGLIKSNLVYKIYIKLNKPNNLQVGIYALDKTMSLKEIVDILNGGSTYNPYVVDITIKEGNNIRKIASIIDENTDNSYDDVLNKLNDNTYISSLIEEYWFLTDDILNSKIYYPLEGYLFPETYQISSKSTVEEIFKVLLDQTEKVLDPYKENIENSKYTIHEIMTLASIVELEAGNANDRAGVAGAFYNRLDDRWSLGSDVTTYYYLKLDDFSISLDGNPKLYDCDKAYNTRCTSYIGLPIGPISNPGEESISAVVNPTSHNYHFFIADCKGKTYFFTEKEYKQGKFRAKINQLKAEHNWCG